MANIKVHCEKPGIVDIPVSFLFFLKIPAPKVGDFNTGISNKYEKLPIVIGRKAFLSQWAKILKNEWQKRLKSDQ